MSIVRAYLDLTKIGIVIFILIAGTLGFLLGVDPNQGIKVSNYWNLMLGLFFLGSSSFIFNQLQEIELDKKMQRTARRPLATGQFEANKSFFLGLIYLALGVWFTSKCSLITLVLGLLTLVFYNGFYTLIWKPKWAFGAVPGAIPGALPIVIGYSAANTQITSTESVYLFFLMFLWQMPHFWAIAMKIKDDYTAGGVPVLPAVRGDGDTLYFMGLYVFAYVALALASPLFVKSHLAYLCVVVPVALKVLLEFFRFFASVGKIGWVRFFTWINVSMVLFMIAPVFDKWYGIFL
ncbi:MAG: protoheme IX farnesyltransferase [Pseudomonadota bacterium]|mgnify:CR=1 FL=1|nr:protoheme IX farnesyltransferase [Pseudomonadota bacterium]